MKIGLIAHGWIPIPPKDHTVDIANTSRIRTWAAAGSPALRDS